MKHKHYDLIVAKAANMDSVLLQRTGYGEWISGDFNGFPTFDGVEYFLCLPQHKDACLHWLNGGEVEILDGKGFYSFACYAVNGDWYPDHAFMNEHEEFRIKPKKEKRLISVYGDSVEFVDLDLAYPACVQFIEIEVEV